MKKFIRFSILSFAVAAFLCGTASFARAEDTAGVSTSNSNSSDVRAAYSIDSFLLNGAKLDANTKAKFEATLKAEKIRCEALTDATQKKLCLTKSQEWVRSSLEKMTGAKIEFRDEKAKTQTLGAGANGNVRSEIKGEKAQGQGEFRGGSKNFVENFTKRFEQAITHLEAVAARLSKLADRIDARLKMLSSQGVDVSVGVKAAATAREELRLANTAIEAAQVSFKSELAAAAKVSETSDTTDKADTTLRASFAGTIRSIMTAKDYLKKSHAHLVEAIRSVKQGNSVDARIELSN